MHRFRMTGTTLFTLCLFAALGTTSAEAKRYYIKAVAWCTDCGDTTRVPLQTTGKGFASKAECETAKRELVATIKRNKLKVQASCKVK